ncbi:unnamed protein product, partial [Polarella glacialis]
VPARRQTRRSKSVSSLTTAAENVVTCVRLRPFLPSELVREAKPSASRTCVVMEPESGQVVLYDPQKPRQATRVFSCDFAFDSSDPSNASENFADQRAIYEKVGATMVEAASSGLNCCLCAYGQTGTGKTHTVHGDWQSEQNRGLLPRIAKSLFERFAQLRAQGSTVK